MKKWLENIKSKSDPEKQVFVFWTSLLITLFIFTIWLFGTIYSFQNPGSDLKDQSASPIESIKNKFNIFFEQK